MAKKVTTQQPKVQPKVTQDFAWAASNPRTLSALIVWALERVRDQNDNGKRWKGELADYCECSVRKVEGWLYGETLPNACEFIRLVRWLDAEAREAAAQLRATLDVGLPR